MPLFKSLRIGEIFIPSERVYEAVAAPGGLTTKLIVTAVGEKGPGLIEVEVEGTLQSVATLLEHGGARLVG